tara:strand:+ start:273 stop:1268 length:996 start_codon:yes stop_codon:yes gene_type:complete
MAGKKFSEFDSGLAMSGNSFVVGYDTTADTNNRWTLAELATGLGSSITTLYSGDGTVGTTRVAKITDTLEFKNAAGTATLFTLNDNGSFTLGEGATVGNDKAVAIGNSATATSNGIAIGDTSNCAVGNAVCIGGYASVGGDGGVSIGYDVDSTAAGDGSINIGSYIANSATNSMVFHCTNTNGVTHSTANNVAFYVTSNATPDFSFVAGGTSTLKSNLTVEGQTNAPIFTITYADPPVIDWDNGSIQTVTLTGSPATAIAAPSNPKDGATYILIVKQDATGGRTFAGGWNAVFKWKGGTAPTLSAGANAVDIITFVCDGTDYYGVDSLNFS